MVQRGGAYLYRSDERNQQKHIDGNHEGKRLAEWHQWLPAPKTVETKAGKDKSDAAGQWRTVILGSRLFSSNLSTRSAWAWGSLQAMTRRLR